MFETTVHSTNINKETKYQPKQMYQLNVYILERTATEKHSHFPANDEFLLLYKTLPKKLILMVLKIRGKKVPGFEPGKIRQFK